MFKVGPRSGLVLEKHARHSRVCLRLVRFREGGVAPARIQECELRVATVGARVDVGTMFTEGSDGLDAGTFWP